MKSEFSRAIPIMKNMWIGEGREAVLIGSQCNHCEEMFFPIKVSNFCPQCHSKGMSHVNLSKEGRIHAFTIVNQQPAGGFYKGPVPFCYGIVCLPDGVNIYTQFTKCDWGQMKIGQKAQFVIEKLYEQGDQEILTYKFAPIF